MDNLVNLLPVISGTTAQAGVPSGLTSSGKGMGQAFAGILNGAAGEGAETVLPGNTAMLGLTQLALLNQLPLQNSSQKEPEGSAATGAGEDTAAPEEPSNEELAALLSQFFPVVDTTTLQTVLQQTQSTGTEASGDLQTGSQQNADLVKLMQVLNPLPAEQTLSQELSQMDSLSKKGMTDLSSDTVNQQFSNFSQRVQELLQPMAQQKTAVADQSSVPGTVVAADTAKKVSAGQMSVQMSQMLQNSTPVQRTELPLVENQKVNTSSNPDLETVSVVSVVSNTAEAQSQSDADGFTMLDQKANASEEMVTATAKDNHTATSFAGVLDLQNSSAKQTVTHSAVHSAARQAVSDPYDVAGQIVERASLIKQPFQTDSSEMVIKLKPEHLGELTLRIAVENGQVSASFHSNNAEVRGIIENSLAQLKQDMSSQGLKVDNVGVYAGLSQFHSGEHQQTSQQQPVMKFKNKKAEEEMVAAIEEAQINQSESDSGVNYLV